MAYSWTYIVLSVLGLVALVGAGIFFFRNGTVKAAVQTVGLLQAQVDALQDDNKHLSKEIERLRSTVSVLTEQVTQAAAVKELANKSELHHEENLLALARLETGLSRLETHFLRGER